MFIPIDVKISEGDITKFRVPDDLHHAFVLWNLTFCTVTLGAAACCSL